LLALVLIGCGGGEKDLTVSGRIEADRVRIGSKIGGRIEKVNAEEGDDVKAGEVVIELESAELQAQLAQARALAAQAQAEVDLLAAGARAEDVRRAEGQVNARQAELQLREKGFRPEEVREAEAQLASTKSDLELARKEYERARKLLESATIDREEFDRKRMVLETQQAAAEIARQRLQLRRSGSRPEEISLAKAQLAQAEAELERLKNGARPEEIAAARAALEAGRANATRIESQLAEMRILAPSDAMAETLDLEPGDLVKPGEAAAVLIRKGDNWVRCYVPENRLGLVRPGKKVLITVDSYPGEVFPGIVRWVSAEAEFTPRNVQTSEKRAELVFEMKVDIKEKDGKLRPGMYADVHIGEEAGP
jgi:multidrug resistance efflux pump